jgi:hypothetical protein
LWVSLVAGAGADLALAGAQPEIYVTTCGYRRAPISTMITVAMIKTLKSHPSPKLLVPSASIKARSASTA